MKLSDLQPRTISNMGIAGKRGKVAKTHCGLGHELVNGRCRQCHAQHMRDVRAAKAKRAKEIRAAKRLECEEYLRCTAKDGE